MNLAVRLKRRLRILFRRDDVEMDLSDEIRLHLDMETEELVRQGRSLAEARREARLLLGGVEQTKEAARDARPLHWIGGLGLDLRLGLRMLRKSWGLTLVGGLAMTIVIAVCASASVILNTAGGGSTLPLRDGDRIVRLVAFDRTKSSAVTQIRHYERWRGAMQSVENITAFQSMERDLITPDRAAGRVSVARMTAPGFRVAQVQPLLGRFLLEEDERAGAPSVAVIGYDVWRSRFAGDPNVLGRTARIGGVDYIVVGVMPAEFAFPINHNVWTPLRPGSIDEAVRVFGKLASGATVESAGAELASVGAEPLAASGPPPLVVRLGSYAQSFTLLLGPNPAIFRVVPFLLALLLIPPCANIAILIYARNVTRAPEFAARYVLGAARGRIVGQLLVETLVLAACAGAVGLAVTQQLLEWAEGYKNQDAELRGVLPYWMKLNLSFETILYIAALVLFAAFIAGGIPALRATGRIAQAGFQGLGSRSGGARLGRTWTALVVVQVALSMAVLPVAASQVWVFLRAAIVGPGFAADEYLTAQVAIDDQRSPARFRDLQAKLVRQLETESGVRGVTMSYEIPEVEPGSTVEIALAGHEPFLATSNSVDSAFFKVFPAPLLTGRGFEPADFNPGRPVVIVTRSFADRVGTGVNPLGIRVRKAAAPDAEPGPWFEIVGVVEGISTSKDLPTIYHAMQPLTVQPGQDRSPVSMALRIGPAIPPGLAARLQEIATNLGAGLRVDQLRPLKDVYQEAQRDEKIVSFALAIVVAVVLLFSAAGIYTLAAFAVAQRRREIAIRAAVGAQPRRLVADIFGRTLLPVIAGAGLGMLLAMCLGARLENKISAIGVCVPAVFLIAIGFLAVAGPARSALRVDATEALRES